LATPMMGAASEVPDGHPAAPTRIDVASAPSLETLPPEILQAISSHLPADDVLHLALSNKALQANLKHQQKQGIRAAVQQCLTSRLAALNSDASWSYWSPHDINNRREMLPLMRGRNTSAGYMNNFRS